MPKTLLSLLILLTVAGCSSLPKEKPATVVKAPEPEIEEKPFSAETLYTLLAAEIAGARQQYDITLGNYIQQAHKTKDLGVIARAARIAQFLRSHQAALDAGLLWLSIEPDNREANLIVANELIELGRLSNALTHAEKIISDGQNTIFEAIANRSARANVSTRQELLRRYQVLNERYPSVAAIGVGLSLLYEQNQQLEPALSAVNKTLKQSPDHIPAIIQRAKLLHRQQQTALAVSEVRIKLDQFPQDNRLRLMYARLLTSTDLNDAYKQFETLAKANPGQPDILFSQALIGIELKRFDAAKAILNRLANGHYRKPVVNFYLGHIAEQTGNLDEALEYYLEVPATLDGQSPNQDFITAHSRAARIMAAQGRLKDSRKHFATLRQQAPKQAPLIFGAEADMLEQLGQAEASLSLLSSALEQYPDNIPLRYGRAIAYEKTDQALLMEQDLRHILNIDGENASALNALGYFLTNKTNRHDEALSLIKRALAIRPNDPAILDSMGWALYRLGEYQQSIEYLTRALKALPDGEIAAHLGEVLWVSGEQTLARQIWREALERDPEDARVLETMERLQVSP